jgi:CheY-like chemotaxis protein
MADEQISLQKENTHANFRFYRVKGTKQETYPWPGIRVTYCCRNCQTPEWRTHHRKCRRKRFNFLSGIAGRPPSKAGSEVNIMARILVADDDQAILDATKLFLEYEGFEVITASDGDTVRQIQTDLPDVILLDIWLSGADGTEIARFLKQQAHTRHIPIILSSANRNIKELARMADVEDVLVKPFDLADLL